MNFLSSYNFMSSVQLKSMYSQNSNTESRISLTTNSSSATRIVRKRDSSDSALKQRSKSKERYDNKEYDVFLKHIKNSTSNQQSVSESLEKLKDNVSLKKISNHSKTNDTGNGKGVFSRIRLNVLEENSNPEIKKKREPTPVRSRNNLKKDDKVQPSKIEKQKFEMDLVIAGMQNDLALERAKNKKLEIENNNHCKKITHLNSVLEKLKKENETLLRTKNKADQKVLELERAILQNENALNVTKNTLNKLKMTIKENKLTQIQNENKKLDRENSKMKEKIEKIEAQNSQMKKETSSLKGEIEQLKKKLDCESLLKKESMKEDFLSREVESLKKELVISKNEKEKFLEDKIKEKDEEIYQLNCMIKNLKLKIHVLEHSTVKEVKQVKQNKETQLKKLKVKYSKLLNEIKKKSGSHQMEFFASRSTILERPRRDSFSFELSPQNSEER